MIERAQALSIFETMLLIRRFEETVIDLWATVETEGHRHVYIGQEAVGATIMELLRDDDLILTTHRNHGHVIARGADPGRALAEILGRADGFNKGRGGSAGLTVREAGFLATTGQVGGGVGLGIGAAQAQKVKGRGGICVTFFGDGGLEEGIGFEAMNIAALYRLPVLLVCENNSVGVTTGRAQNEWSSSSMAAGTLGDVPRALGIATEVVAGESVTAVHDAASRLIGDLREGRAPAFIEMRTRRWPGSRSFNPQLVTGVTDLAGIWDPDSVTGEHAEWINQYDPVIGYGRELMHQGQVDRDEIRALDERVIGQVQAAREFALASPLPSEESGLTGTFA